MTAPKPWRIAAASLSLVAAAALAAADEAYLVRDIYPGGERGIGSEPRLIQTEVGPSFLFAQDEVHGRELWVSDGTAAGTRLVRDICPGRCSSEPRQLGFLGARLLFSARSAPSADAGLWISDGTWEGTRALGATLPTGAVGTLEDRDLFFFGAALGSETGLWVTDGTPGGTRPFALDGPDGWPHPSAGASGSGRLVFAVRSEDFADEIWVTDGTDAGTRRLPVVLGGQNPIFINTLVRVGGRTLVFARSFAPFACENEVWSTDGSPAGTLRLLEFEMQVCSGPLGLFLVGETAGLAWFVAGDEGGTQQLWRSDGTLAGTRAVTSFTGDAFADRLLSLGGGEVLFSADDGVHGREPWIADATGARLLADVCAGFCDSAPAGLGYPGAFYFSADDALLGRELWRREGGAAVLVEDICPGSCSSSPAQLGSAGGRVFFIAGEQGGDPGRELWTTPLGGNGATRLTDFTSFIPFPFHSGFTYTAAAVGDLLLFTADDGPHGVEIWRSDGTPAGTALVADVEPRVERGEGSEPLLLTPWGDRLLLFAREPDLGYQPWASDGTEPGTKRLGIVTGPQDLFQAHYSDPVILGPDALFMATEIPFETPLELWRAPASGAPVRLLALGDGPQAEGVGSARLGGRAVFLVPGFNADVRGPWSSDGTAAGTQRLRELSVVSLAHDGEAMAELGGRLFFAATDDPSSDAFDLWETDGTPAGTIRVSDISTSSFPSAPGPFVRLGDRLLFAARHDDAGQELWETNGTAAGTRLVADLVPGSHGSEPRGLTAAGARVFFFAEDDLGSLELWVTDGTAAGTLRITGVPSFFGNAPGLPKRAGAGGRFYFVTAAAGDPPDLWISDGSVAGTGSLRPLLPASAEVRGIWSAGDRVRVSMTVPGPFETAEELWETDGSFAGTRRLVSLTPIGSPAPISNLAQVGSLLYFQGPHPEAGPELMALPVGPPAPCAADSETLCLRDGRFAVRARWRDPRSGDQGTAGALPLPGSDRTGLFWFFAPDNVELVVKTLDGGGVNGFFWNFYGALSDVEYTIEVEDTATGRRAEYFNPGGEICGRGDTTAFPARSPVPLPVPPAAAPVRSAASAGSDGTACGGDPGDLCLFGDRFRVEVEWSDQRSGDSGAGTAIPFADRSGFFWFFEPQNVELVVKILDGTAVNGRFWVFFGGLSDVAYTITVTDTETEEQAVYHNAQGDICGRGDTTAF